MKKETEELIKKYDSLAAEKAQLSHAYYDLSYNPVRALSDVTWSSIPKELVTEFLGKAHQYTEERLNEVIKQLDEL
jgi:hypothetical protein